MEKLTERDEYGNADIVGVDSAELQFNLEFDEFNKVTDALNRLAAYEDTGLTPEKIETQQQLVERLKQQGQIAFANQQSFIEAQQQEIDRLRAENKEIGRLQIQAEETSEKLICEIERLKQILQKYGDSAIQKGFLFDEVNLDNVRTLQQQIDAVAAEKDEISAQFESLLRVKDEQAGRIVRMEEGLKRAKHTLEWLNIQGGLGYVKHDALDARIKAIDALLGGAEG